MNIYASAELVVELDDGVKLRVGARAGHYSKIIEENLLYLDKDLNPDGFYELWGMRRLDAGVAACPKTVLRIASYVMPIFFTISEGKPLYIICSARAAPFYERVYKRFGFEIIRGSLMHNNPYPPLVLYNKETGGSNDEHIIKLSPLT